MIRALVLAVVLVACTGVDAPPQSDEGGRAPAEFDVDAVISTFDAECPEPLVVDDAFCEQVEIAAMAADGQALIVPTLLNASATDRAQAICEQFATFHFDAEAKDLGYTVIGVLDRDGRNAAACTVAP